MNRCAHFSSRRLAFAALASILTGNLFGSLVVQAETGDAELQRPNILYLYVDDMGWGSIGPNGQSLRKSKGLPSVRTPHLDRLAARGLNFTRGYGCHVCSPARSSQQSGFHQGHTFADRNDPNNAKKAMRADDLLMGDMLSRAGYTTGYWGKWGYGGSKSQQNPVIENVQTLPTSHGYRHVLAELHHVRAHTFFQPTLWHAPAPAGSMGGLHLVPNSMSRYRNSESYPKTPALQDHAQYPETGYCDDAYAFAALDFIREQGTQYHETGTPFFGLLAVQIPHAPFKEVSTLPEWDQAYADDPHFDSLADQTKQWAAMVTRIDAHFGNLFAALEDPNNDGNTDDSIAENTLVVFQSDNGGPGGKNNEQLDANGGLSGVKGRIQEGGIRVPLVMRWPARINDASDWKAGTSTDMVVDVTDLLPTFCQLAGTAAPLGIDGMSIAPMLTGTGHQRRRSFVIHEAGNGQSIIQENYKLVRSGKTGLSLYDLANDPAELHDIAAENVRLVEKLNELLLGERVDEPRGFANTYHHWTGVNGASVSDASNWSDYEYSNAGVTYMTDAGAPRLSWVAHLRNEGEAPNVAMADSKLDVLALDIGGDQATQTLKIETGGMLNGRNGIRISAGGILDAGGPVNSLRWLDIEPGGVLLASSRIDADVFNGGTIEATHLRMSQEFRQADSGCLKVTLDGSKRASIGGRVEAVLGGQLEIELSDDFNAQPGTERTIIKAGSIVGRFQNEGDRVVAPNGTTFKIQYHAKEVRVVVE